MLTLVDPLLIIIAITICVAGIVKRSRLWMMGQPGDELDSTGARIRTLFFDGILHGRILRDAFPGVMHLLIFLAFLAPVAAIVLSQFSVIFPPALSGFISIVLDLIGFAGLIGIGLAAYRRYIQKPDRLSDTKAEDGIALLWVFAILLTGFCIEGLRLAITGQGAGSAPVGALFSYIFMPLGSLKPGLHALLWRVHILLLLALLAAIPYTKFLHLFTSAANIFLKSFKHPGAFPQINFETAEVYGVNSIEQYKRKQLFDLDACIRCGRCQDNCPAHLSEKPLSPKKLIQDMKAHMEEKWANPACEKALIGDIIDHDVIWACTMCLNCTEHCPVNDTTVDKTIELRRYLVMTDPNFPAEAQSVFRNMENNSNPWGIGAHTRADWAAGLDVKTCAEGEPFDVLFYPGCAGAFDDRYKKIAVALVKIMHKAGIRFAILGTEESCCGDSARRLGNEYLYDTLAQANIAAMQGYNVKKILTICPHCLNSLKNDYPAYGVDFEVMHSSEFLLELVQQGRIKLKSGEKMTVCYHDSCFLGRYNNIYDQPRRLLSSIGGVQLVEMDRSRARSFCCGAGGGRMWLEEDHGKRINEMRTDQALEKNPNVIATACPYCLTMLDDGIKVREKAESVKSLDIVELILNAME